MSPRGSFNDPKCKPHIPGVAPVADPALGSDLLHPLLGAELH